MHRASRRPGLWGGLVLFLFVQSGWTKPASPDAGSVVSAPEVCESKTINYITHTLPQQCLRTTWSGPTPVADTQATESVNDTTARGSDAAQQNETAKGASPEGDKPVPPKEGQAQEEDHGELETSSFMSFEEWKEMMVRKSGQDPAEIKGRKPREHRSADNRDTGLGNGGIDVIGEDGELDLDFDALSEKVSELTGSSRSGGSGDDGSNAAQAATEEPVLYDNGKTQYYRSKDAGKTCKERFSYSSFDAGATVLKTSPGAKNAKALLVENKDSYMLMECHTKNKFVIVELSDDILVDTVVLANFEFFSSMIRKFRVSVSDRYPVKLDKWVDLGTFEARNSRDIQPFLVEHPQIYTKYIRIEFLSHYGTEFYCPVSLLRVHGTRMLDSWKEPDPSEVEETIDAPPREEVAEDKAEENAAKETAAPQAEEPEQKPEVLVNDTGLTYWQPQLYQEMLFATCAASSPTTMKPTPVSMDGNNSIPSLGRESSLIGQISQGYAQSETSQASPSPATPPSTPESSSAAVSAQSPSSSTASSSSSSSSTVTNSTPGTSTNPSSSQKQTTTKSSSRTNGSKSDTTDPVPPSSSLPSSSKTASKTSTSSSPPPASPTVQESFFKTVTKRLQLLESNTSLSLQYIEEQSRFLQEALTKMEKKQLARVDTFLDSLNRTVLADLRGVRAQYDQIWQSTVLALETQREQSQREAMALTGRLNVLADEVVFQKRMAILQSLLLLACLVLVIFSRAFAFGQGGGAAAGASGISAWDMALHQYQSHQQSHRRGSVNSAGPSPPRGGVGRNMMAADSPPLSAEPDDAAEHAGSPRPSTRRGLGRGMSAFRDKVLPLTPTSECESEPTPVIRVEEVDTPFFHDVGSADSIAAAADTSSDLPDCGKGVSDSDLATALTPPQSHADQDDGRLTPEPESVSDLGHTAISAEDKPLARRSSSVQGVKPLPALPEDTT